MTTLYNELLKRFPEMRHRLSQEDEELPYLLMNHLADWLKDMTPDEVSPAILGRVAEFVRWCEDQPRAASAAEDLYTILLVGFYERLFASDSTRALVPHLIPHEDILRNADYLKQWVGPENYERALALYNR
jgi:hypothetical protein